MSNYNYKCNYSDYNYSNYNPKKYDSRNLSPNNINFILSPSKQKKTSNKKMINDFQNNSDSKIISFNYYQENPHYKYTHVYTIPNDVKYNLTHSIGNIENDIKIKSEKNNEIKVKSIIDNKNI